MYKSYVDPDEIKGIDGTFNALRSRWFRNLKYATHKKPTKDSSLPPINEYFARLKLNSNNKPEPKIKLDLNQRFNSYAEKRVWSAKQISS